MPPKLNKPSGRVRALLVAALLVVLSLAAFGVNLNGPFIWDDNIWLTDNEAVQHGNLGWIWIHHLSSPSFCPLTLTTFWAEFHAWGLWAPGYRIINIVLHAASAFLLWRVLKKIHAPGALLAAVIWAVHPLQVETVVWITERKNTLSAVFFFASLLLWCVAMEPSTSRRKKQAAYAASLAVFMLALLAKAATVFLPVAALAVVLVRFGYIGRRKFLLTIPMFLLAAIMGANALFVEHYGAAAGYGPEWEMAGWQRVILAGKCFWFYPAKMLWPVNLVPVYPRWELHAGDALAYLWPASAVAVIALTAWMAWRRKIMAPFCAVIVYTAGIFPVIGFLKFYTQIYTYVADHYAYLPMAALIAVAAGIMTRALRDWRMINGKTIAEQWLRPAWTIPAASAALIATLTTMACAQSMIYSSNLRLWSEVARVSPNAWIAYNNMAVDLFARGQYQEALEKFEHSLSLRPDPLTQANIGITLEKLNQPDRSLTFYAAAVAGKAPKEEPYRRLASAALARGHTQRAIDICRTAVEVNPRWISMWTALGALYQKTGQDERAADAYRHYLRLDPQSPEVRVKLGVIAQRHGEWTEAIGYYRAALELNPAQLDARRRLAETLRQAGMADEAQRAEAALKELEERMNIHSPQRAAETRKDAASTRPE